MAAGRALEGSGPLIIILLLNKKEQAYPPNFAVVAIPRKMLTLELPSEEIAIALVDFINKSPFTTTKQPP